MRDLEMEELTHVYGAGGRCKSPAPPKHRPRCGKGGSGRGKGGSSRGRGRGRCGKGGSS